MVSPYIFASSMMPSVVVRQKSAFGDEVFSTVSHASCETEMFLCTNGRMKVASHPRPTHEGGTSLLSPGRATNRTNDYREAEPHDGLFIDKEDEPVKDLAWPEGIVGMMLCHLNWADGFSYTLYTLLPVRSKRSVKDIQMVEKNRSAGWQKGAIYK